MKDIMEQDLYGNYEKADALLIVDEMTKREMPVEYDFDKFLLEIERELVYRGLMPSRQERFMSHIENMSDNFTPW